MVGIKRIRIDVEVDGQMSSLMIATVLRELADEIATENYIYARDVSITQIPDINWFKLEPKS